MYNLNTDRHVLGHQHLLIFCRGNGAQQEQACFRCVTAELQDEDAAAGIRREADDTPLLGIVHIRTSAVVCQLSYSEHVTY